MASQPWTVGLRYAKTANLPVRSRRDGRGPHAQKGSRPIGPRAMHVRAAPGRLSVPVPALALLLDPSSFSALDCSARRSCAAASSPSLPGRARGQSQAGPYCGASTSSWMDGFPHAFLFLLHPDHRFSMWALCARLSRLSLAPYACLKLSCSTTTASFSSLRLAPYA